jgi:hypothetical protein
MGVTGESEAALGATGMIPITEAAALLGRTPWTLKRWHRLGLLPAVIMLDRWYVPASFIALLLSSPQPKRAGALEDVARAWFAAHSAKAGASA